MQCHLCYKIFQYQKITPLCEDVGETCCIMAAICGTDMPCLQQIFAVSYFELSFIDRLYILTFWRQNYFFNFSTPCI